MREVGVKGVDGDGLLPSFPSPFLKSHPYHSHIRASHAHSHTVCPSFHTPLAFATHAGPKERSDHLEEYYGFRCTCLRCEAAGDVSRELDFADRLEARRCSRNECGSGLSVPVLPARAPVEGEGDEEEGDEEAGCGEELRGGLLGGDDAVGDTDDEEGIALRCVHCGGVWQSEPDEWAEWRPL